MGSGWGHAAGDQSAASSSPPARVRRRPLIPITRPYEGGSPGHGRIVSTPGRRRAGWPTRAQIGDRAKGRPRRWQASSRALSAGAHRPRAARDRSPCRTRCLNMCRFKCDQQRCRTGPSPRTPTTSSEHRCDARQRLRRRPDGWAVKCATGGPHDDVYIVIQLVCWAPIATLIGPSQSWVPDPEVEHNRRATAGQAGPMFQLIEEWTLGICSGRGSRRSPRHQSVRPVLSRRRKEIIEDSRWPEREGVRVPATNRAGRWSSQERSAARSSCPTSPSTAPPPTIWASTTTISPGQELGLRRQLAT